MKFDRIFLIDDEPLINSIQNLILRDYFPENTIDKYYHADQALEKIISLDGSIQNLLIFVDLNMPVMSGEQFLDKLKAAKLNFNIEAYVITFSLDEDEIEKVAKHSLVKEVLRKPIKPEKLDKITF